METTPNYSAILQYLQKRNMTFCFLESGEFVSREDCKIAIAKEKQSSMSKLYA